MSGHGASEAPILRNPEVLQFLKYAATYCAVIETEAEKWDKSQLLQCREALAGVYLYACRLPELPIDPFLSLERMLEEAQYERIRERLEEYFGEHDRFLNAQMEGMQYSESPINVSTAELLADMYQVLADTVWIFRHQIERNMVQAIAEVKYTFEHEWGSLLLALLRQLHDLMANPETPFYNVEWDNDSEF